MKATVHFTRIAIHANMEVGVFFIERRRANERINKATHCPLFYIYFTSCLQFFFVVHTEVDNFFHSFLLI